MYEACDMPKSPSYLFSFHLNSMTSSSPSCSQPNTSATSCCWLTSHHPRSPSNSLAFGAELRNTSRCPTYLPIISRYFRFVFRRHHLWFHLFHPFQVVCLSVTLTYRDVYVVIISRLVSQRCSLFEVDSDVWACKETPQNFDPVTPCWFKGRRHWMSNCSRKFLVFASLMLCVGVDWIGLSSVLRPRQHSIGYMGDWWMDGWLGFNGILSTQIVAISCLRKFKVC